VEVERTTAARAEVPVAAFQMPLEQAGLKEHIFNILTEASFETVGQLIFAIKTDANKVLGLPGIGAKAMQNIEESLAALTFPEPEPEPEPAKMELEAPAIVGESVAEPVTAEEIPAEKNPAEGKKEAKKAVEEEEAENAKDGVALDELFKMKPEIFQNAGPAEEETSDSKKKGKKGKKKAVELQFDEGLGAVVGRKIHKRGDSTPDNDWE
jgi:hypothetical protein